MELPKNKKALIASIAAGAVVSTVALAVTVWPALTRPDPPAEATGRDGLRVSVVEPPKASVARAGPLDVGLSEAAKAMAKGREALFAGTPAVRPLPAPAPARRPSPQVAQADVDDVAPPPERIDDRWERGRGESGYELTEQRWEDNRQARRERERRAAWEQDQREQRRWEEAREPERDRYDDRRRDDRYAPPPPPEDDRPPLEPW